MLESELVLAPERHERHDAEPRRTPAVPLVAEDHGVLASHQRQRALEPRFTQSIAPTRQRILGELSQQSIARCGRDVRKLVSRKAIGAVTDGNAGFRMRQHHRSPEGRCQCSDEQAVLPAGVHQRQRAHRIGACAIGVQPLPLGTFQLATDVDDGPGSLRNSVLARPVTTHFSPPIPLPPRRATAAPEAGSPARAPRHALLARPTWKARPRPPPPPRVQREETASVPERTPHRKPALPSASDSRAPARHVLARVRAPHAGAGRLHHDVDARSVLGEAARADHGRDVAPSDWSRAAAAGRARRRTRSRHRRSSARPPRRGQPRLHPEPMLCRAPMPVKRSTKALTSVL